VFRFGLASSFFSIDKFGICFVILPVIDDCLGKAGWLYFVGFEDAFF
jgi:hypothetical protein